MWFARIFRGGELALAYSLQYSCMFLGAAACGLGAPPLMEARNGDIALHFWLAAAAVAVAFGVTVGVWCSSPLGVLADGACLGGLGGKEGEC